MKENISIGVAVLAIIISIVAIASTVIVKPTFTIGAGAIGENELADNSVTSSKVVDGTLTDADISDSGISKIASSSITLAHLTTEVIAAMTGVVDIANNSITGAKIADGTITNVDIANNTLKGANIADGAITGAKIADDAITTAKIADGTIVTKDLADDAITSAKIADGTIDTADLLAGAITQSKEDVGNVTQTTTAFLPNYDLLTTEVKITTDDSTILCMFSGVLSVNADHKSARVVLFIDGSAVSHTVRRGTSGTTGETFTLAFTAINNVSAGLHTIQIGWNTDSGTTASIFNHTLDVIELKR